jgi:hypothetical protein
MDNEVCAVGFVPSTPLLVPDLAGPMPGEPDAIRAASREVVDGILSCHPDRVVVVGACQNLNDSNGTWDFSGFGLPRRTQSEGRPLPWQLGLGAWLLDDRGWAGCREFVGACSAESAGSGGALTAYLAVGDGSVYFPSQLPDGAESERSRFDAEVARAVATGDVALLAGVVATSSDAIGANGTPVWTYVAGAVGNAEIATSALVYDESPFGVRYIAGWWLM